MTGGNTATNENANPSERSERITTPYLTKYERARILGTRALQIRYFYMRNRVYFLRNFFVNATLF
jgi:hypothetical protein